MAFSLELHGAKTGNSLRVAVALEEAALPYVAHPLDLLAGGQHAPAHLALNPRGKVPVLVVRGAHGGSELVLTQSNAIALWIDAQAPGRLLPEDGRSRATAIERWLFFVTDVIAPSHAAFRLRRAGLGADAVAHLDREAIQALCDAERFLMEGTSGDAFMAGDMFTLADVAGYTIATAYADTLDWPRLPKLRRWYDAVAARPAVRRAMAAFG